MSLTSSSPALLLRAIPQVRGLEITLIAGFVALNAAAAQVSVPLPFTPIPLTLQTFAVLLTGSALGGMRGLITLGIYVAAGALGAPWFAGGNHGIGGPTTGYLVGFLVAAFVVGKLAERRATHSVKKTFLAFAVGTFLIYACGVPWLMVSTGMGLNAAIAAGLTPFLLGDTLKACFAGLLLPGVWRLMR
jgi:biotin transport system substrate-specific component